MTEDKIKEAFDLSMAPTPLQLECERLREMNIELYQALKNCMIEDRTEDGISLGTINQSYRAMSLFDS